MKPDDFFDTCNKSVPVYILSTRKSRLLTPVLHNYIYRRWFRPYRSEIERQRFMCKFIAPRDLPDKGLQSTIESLIPLNRAICAEVEARRRSYDDELRALIDKQVPPMKLFVNRDHRFSILQPLFQALLIVICSKSYNNEDSKTVGSLPVLLVRTGVEDGLSAPISFESIAGKIDGCAGEAGNAVKTTLETAVDFVMDLEAREAAAFGLQPDPVATWEPYSVVASCWKKLRPGEPLIGPSSGFVDTEKYLQWSGAGEHADSRIMTHFEQRAFRHEARRVAGLFICSDPPTRRNSI